MNKIYILILIGVMIAGCSSYNVDFAGKVHKKNDEDTGIEDVNIVSGNIETTTDDDGNFTIDGETIDSGATIRLFLDKKGYKSKEVSVKLEKVSEDSSDLRPASFDSDDEKLSISMEEDN